MCVLGSMIVVRRTRATLTTTAADGQRSLSFSSNSAGLSLAFLGTLMVIFSILNKDKYAITDAPTEVYINKKDSLKNKERQDTVKFPHWDKTS